jgi:hypothetical protein
MDWNEPRELLAIKRMYARQAKNQKKQSRKAPQQR